MEDQEFSDEHLNLVTVEGEEEEEFRSCCGEDSEDECLSEESSEDECLSEEDRKNKCLKEEEDSEDECDDLTVKMCFKGISIDGFGDSCSSGFTGIGVVIQGSKGFSDIIVQKRLEFYVDGLVADYLALMDGLLEVFKSSINNIRRVFATTDSKTLYGQIMLKESLDIPLIVAFRERVLELVGQLDAFSLKHVPSVEVERPLQLAQVAIGLFTLHEVSHGSLQNCSVCCDDKPSSMMLTLRCSHKFCSQCLKTHANEKVEAGQVPIGCPEIRCNYLLSKSECKLFLPVIFFDVLDKAIEEFNVLSSDKIYCPYQNCLALLDPSEASSSDESNGCCIDCPVCQRSICVNCGVPSHNSLTCGEYQDLPLDERGSSDLSLHCLAQDRGWRHCQQCRRMIDLAQGCYHMTCWCGHEFCYSCGAEYREGQQTCQCAFWDEGRSEDSIRPTTPDTDHWAWTSFDTFPMILDAYSDQERSQLAIIQRFLAGGFSLSDHRSCQLPPPPCTDSYIDAMKDLHQLPWLERFVSVISDNYYDDYIR
ncbi:uncharacterized protein LOC110706209 [Chenopodium quinoa]|uniref:RBR-type E3 ubiquitin transferase n=1 Tax=Chenopodium quinoa TaxID=63459 RepID=A0A803NAU2_CHEQI|nr:uncharacterized protein LOC110706209 [Chenopodium quinoa]